MLVLLCGKMGAGKSTKAIELAKARNAVLISEDVWLSSLYPNQIFNIEDYVRLSNLMKPLVKSLVQDMLKSDGTVVMDFPANTVRQRQWLKSIFSELEVKHELIYLRAADNVCLQQIEKRRIQHPERAKTDTKEMFLETTKYFVEPSISEGFNITIIE